MKKISIIYIAFILFVCSEDLTIDNVKKLKHDGSSDIDILEKVKAAGGLKKVANIYNKLLDLGIDQNIIDQMLTVTKHRPKSVNLSEFTFLYTKTYSCGGKTHNVKEYRHNQSQMEFILISGGSFTMGGATDFDEQPVHRVIVDSFLLAKYEVTQGMWQKAMRTTPWKGKKYVKEGEKYAVTHVNWYDAYHFCEIYGWRLPTEAEWEYACRAGTNTKYYWGDSIDGRYTWFDRNSWDTGEQYAHIVGKKLPNAFGLYDMTGNVWEWCSDWFGSYANSPLRNPQGASSGLVRTNRGGSWFNVDWSCRSATRFRDPPESSSSYLGFRPCVTWRVEK